MTCLSGNALKLIAALSMVLDHVGLMFFPQVPLFRILGRLAFPIFGYMIAEGCKYTRSPRRYLGFLAAFAALCQVVYYLFDGSLYFSVLVTFSLSIAAIFALDRCKARRDWVGALAFLGAVALLWAANRFFTIDYGFWGCMVPVFASLPTGTRLDTTPCRVGCLGLGLIPLAFALGGVQWFSLLSLPVLLGYNGKRGKWKLKYFFYIFYPLHLVLLQGLQLLLQ